MYPIILKFSLAFWIALIPHPHHVIHHHKPPPVVVTAPAPVRDLAYYSCADLESLWIEEGGNPDAAFVAAEIATAESGGNPNAISPTDDFGLWQINAVHGAMASLDPYVNAQAAIVISDNGADWEPWTTYQTGAYIGRC
jgi:hypothetical protein